MANCQFDFEISNNQHEIKNLMSELELTFWPGAKGRPKWSQLKWRSYARWPKKTGWSPKEKSPFCHSQFQFNLLKCMKSS